MTHALIVEDDADSAAALRALIAKEKFTVSVARTLLEARRHIALQQPDLVLLNTELSDGNGHDLFDDPLLTARSEIVLVTERDAEGSNDAGCLVKPVGTEALQGVLARVMKHEPVGAAEDTPEPPGGEDGHFGSLWGRAPAMRRLYQQISRVAGTDVSVFVSGESGTGKELVAQTVHDLSRRGAKPFLAVNCGAISPQLIESEIFGHEKGSFTGAERQHQGFFERACGGTLFLDEITEMPLDLQVKLLRVLESGRFMRVGSTQSIEADVRVIAASNRPVQQAVATGRLREDLLYRLNVFPLELPPLRERISDVPLLADHFLAEISAREGGPAKRFTTGALQALCAHAWPGNVRELRNAVQRAYVMAAGETVDEEWLPQAQAELAAAHDAGLPPSVTVAIGSSMADIERTVILATLRHFRHHKERTAAALGISLKTLYNRLKEYAAQPAPAGAE